MSWVWLFPLQKIFDMAGLHLEHGWKLMKGETPRYRDEKFSGHTCRASMGEEDAGRVEA